MAKHVYVNIIKPILDRLLALAVVILFWWLFVVIAILVRFKLGSPILFSQERPGKIDAQTGREKIFRLYKFRTMTDERDETGHLLPDEIRLTGFGRFLRASSLDELPELFFNVLYRYDMSLVGPRPQLVCDMVFMSDEQRRRHTVKPGITGLAQVNGRNAISWEEKLNWDLEYIGNIGFGEDIKILWRTITAVFRKDGITDGENATALNYGDVLLKEGKITQCEYEEGCKCADEIMKHNKSPFLIHEVHDMWPATLVEMGGMSRANPFVFVLQRAENSAYKHSDAVVSVLPNSEEYMLEHGLKHGGFHYIPNGTVIRDWECPEELPEDVEKGLEAVSREGGFIVGYFGGHAISNALDTLVDAAKYLKNNIESSNVKIIMVGDGAEKERLRRRIEQEEISNIVMLDSVNKRCIPRLLEKFDCIYIGTKDSSLYRFGLGLNKFFDSMMSGKPIVLSTNAKNTVIESTGCGLIVPAGDPVKVSDAIIRIRDMSSRERETMGQKGKRAILERFAYDKLAQEFENLMGGPTENRNILYINHYAGSDEMGMEYRPYYLASEWVKKGHRVDILAADYSHLRRRNPSINEDFDEEMIDGIHYHWVHTIKYSGNGIKRALSMFQFAGKLYFCAKRIKRQIEPDVIITSSTYPLDTYAGQRIRRVRRNECW